MFEFDVCVKFHGGGSDGPSLIGLAVLALALWRRWRVVDGDGGGEDGEVDAEV